jgi:hypothetical protein
MRHIEKPRWILPDATEKWRIAPFGSALRIFPNRVSRDEGIEIR